MPRNQTQRVLIALDGSARSLETVRQVARFCPPQSIDIVLFHVFSNVPECYYDLEREPKAVKVVPAVRAREGEQRKLIGTHMEKAKEISEANAECLAKAEKSIEKVFAAGHRILEAEGLDPSRITTCVIQGVWSRAEAIAEEAKTGDYATIVLGRRGQSSVKDVFMGRVAHKVIQAARQHSVWIVN